MAGSLCTYEEASETEQAHMKRCFHFEVKGVVIMNPVVFGSSCLFLWGFVIACCVEPDYMKYAMDEVSWGWIPEVWTWIYIMSQDVWVVALPWAINRSFLESVRVMVRTAVSYKTCDSRA